MKNPVRNHRTGIGASRPTKGQHLKRLAEGLRFAVIILIISGLGFAGYQVYARMNMPIQEIQISGEFQQIWSDQIKQKLNGYVGKGLLSLDLRQVQEQIETTPWVAKAQVSRQWPSVLIVHLEQHRLVARWGSNAYVSDQGVLVQGYPVNQDLPILQSEFGDARNLLDQYRLLSQGLSQLGLELHELHENRSGDLDLILNNGIRLKLGNKDLVNRVQRFIAVWRADLFKRADQIGQIDIRYANGLAVNWDNGTEQGAEIQHIGDGYGELARR